MSKTIRILGLQDGIYTAITGLMLREIRSLGAIVTLAKTGRVTLTTAAGERRVYALAVDVSRCDRAALEAIEHWSSGNSPLAQALADLRG